MKVKLILMLALAASVVCGAVPCGGNNSSAAGQTRRQAQRRTAARYECPMHPEVTSRRPGKCPKCGMALRLAKAKEESPAQAASPAAPATEGTAAASSLRIPDATVYNQNGRRLNFYTDLVKGKVVA